MVCERGGGWCTCTDGPRCGAKHAMVADLRVRSCLLDLLVELVTLVLEGVLGFRVLQDLAKAGDEVERLARGDMHTCCQPGLQILGGARQEERK